MHSLSVLNIILSLFSTSQTKLPFFISVLNWDNYKLLRLLCFGELELVHWYKHVRSRVKLNAHLSARNEIGAGSQKTLHMSEIVSQINVAFKHTSCYISCFHLLLICCFQICYTVFVSLCLGPSIGCGLSFLGTRKS